MIRFLGAALMVCAAFAAEPPPKDLMQYIQEAQKLGVPEEAIRKNAAAAGWDAKLVEEAFIVIRQGGAAQAGRANQSLPDGYRIGAGDVLQIAVWREPDASVNGVVVRGDGIVSVPLVKELKLGGLTPEEAGKLITEQLARYVQEPSVTVIIKEIHSRKVYMVGAVRTVGAINLTSRLTVLQAITQAGGLTDYAKRKKIYILRNRNGKQVLLPFNYEAVIRGERMEENIFLEPDDTVVVPQ